MRVKNWERFQHYQSGRGAPPWVKLYRDLLNDKEWFALPPDAAKTLINLWLLAAESNGELPDVNTIAFRLRLASNVIAKHISFCSHWIIHDDSNVLAGCYQLATPETETETETETKEALSDSQANTDVVVLKNGKQKFKGDAEIVLAFLNEKTGRAYRPLTANLDFIAERLKEGATVADCRKVIAKKSREWTGTDMAQYLRPATLFNRTKFAQYVGELHVEQSPIGDYV